MVEIISAGINNYVSQQAAQHTTQHAPQARGSDEAQRSKNTGKFPASQRGVIVQISKEGRNMAKAALTADDAEITMNANRTHKELQTAIVIAKQSQSELQEDAKQSDAILANQQNHKFINNHTMAA